MAKVKKLFFNNNFAAFKIRYVIQQNLVYGGKVNSMYIIASATHQYRFSFV